MAELTPAKRKRLKTTQFAGSNRSYPVNDRSHAANAKARAKQMLDAGKLSQSEYDRIVAKANRVLDRTAMAKALRKHA